MSMSLLVFKQQFKLVSLLLATRYNPLL